ncbi:MAG TPA: CBS domain-containing protein [Kofleriaceae bacterium]|nr:CBS domain-containing protein [Kofleriaceae bacterium]
MIEEIINVAVSQVPAREPIKVSPDTRLGEVVALMHRGKTGAALVVERGRLIGIFTEHDLLRRVEHHSNAWRDQPVRTMMTERPRIIRETHTIAEALRRMDAGHHRHLPVVRGREAISVVSVRDLLAFIASKFPAHFLNLPPDPDKEARGPWGG